MLNSNCEIGGVYTIDDVPISIPCMKCTPCTRLRLMEMGFTNGENIRIRKHQQGLWLVDILQSNGDATSTIGLREEEFQRICLL